MSKMSLASSTILYFFVGFVIFAIAQDFEVRWSRPRVLGDPASHYFNFANTPNEFVALHKRVYFDACPYTVVVQNDSAGGLYRWIVYDRNRTVVLRQFNGSSCLFGWTAPEEATYSLEVERLSSMDGSRLGSSNLNFFIEDIWLVALGDSFASGQGDPDKWGNTKSQPALWIDGACSRSTSSFPFLIYETICRDYPQHGVLFTFLACSGATIRRGLLGAQEEQAAQVTRLLEPIMTLAANQTATTGGSEPRRPDVVLLAVGANDIGFLDVALQVMTGIFSTDSSFQRLNLPEKFQNLSESLRDLDGALRPYRLEPSSMFYFEYYDPSRDERGRFNANCSGLFFATDDDFRRAYEDFMRPLNELIKTESDKYGWTCVCDIAEAFRTHGYCSKNSYIRSVEDSLASQGSGSGIFHPTYQGHEVVAAKAWPRIVERLREKRRG